MINQEEKQHINEIIEMLKGRKICATTLRTLAFLEGQIEAYQRVLKLFSE